MKITKWFNRISIRAKVIIVFISLTAITLTILGAVIFSNWLSSVREVTSDLSMKTNEDISLKVSGFLNNPLELNEAHANLIKNNYVDMLNQEERERFFVLALQNYDDQVYSFSFGTATGEYYGARRNENDEIEIMRNDSTTGGYSWYYSVDDDYTANERVVVAGLFDARTRPWYLEAVESGNTVFSPIYQHFIMEDLAVSLATPIYDTNGVLQGVLGAHMVLSNINSFLSDTLSLNNGSSIIIEKSTLALIANSMGGDNYLTLEDNSIHRVKIDEMDNDNFYNFYQKYQSDQTNTFELRDGFKYEYYSFLEVKENGVDWVIITSIPQGLLFSHIIQNIYWLILVFALSIILLIIIYHLLIKRVFKPVDDLVEISNEYAMGDFKRKMAISGKDEFSKLSDAFNNMADHIKKIVNGLESTVEERTEHLRLTNEILSESEQRFKILHDASFGGLAIHDHGVILDCNQGLSDISGYKIDELIGSDGLELIAPEYRDFVREKIRTGYEKPYEVLGIRKNSEIFPLKLEARNMPYHGKLARVVEFRDITELKESEEIKKSIENQWSKLVKEMPLGFNVRELIFDDEGNPIDYIFISINDNYETITGLKRDDIIGKRATEVLPDIEKSWFDNYAQVVNEKKTVAIEDFSRAIGKYFRVVAYPYKGNQFVVVAEDITERKHFEEQIVRNEDEKSRIISNLPGVSYKCKFDEYWTMVFMSDACENLTGYKPREIINNQKVSFNDLIAPKYRTEIAKRWDEARKLNKPCNMEYELIKKDGSRIWIWEKGITYLQDEQWYIEGFFMDITERKINEEKIIHASKHDFLTGLPNRRYFDEILKKYDKSEYYPLVISMLDIDGLKLINDTYGHNTGDEAIIKFSSVLEKACGDNSFIARIGGDEFVVVFTNTKIEDFSILESKILNDLSKITIQGIPLSASCGSASKTNFTQDVEEILIEAENQMYSNKTLHNQSSKNQVIVALFDSLKDKYEAERNHSDRVSKYCLLMGEKLKLSKQEILELEFAGRMHDIGKITIPDNILKKPGKLTDEEWVIMKNHSINGYQILRSADKYSNLADYALTHHERWDGSGYPKGLAGEDIPLFSRIIHISDAFEAMTSDRPYRKAMKVQEAIEEICKHSGTQFDPNLVDVFVNDVIQSECHSQKLSE
jgi:diguanylate cyclase (GGDEF)-like protein/PAS domain S-box-containing protein